MRNVGWIQVKALPESAQACFLVPVPLLQAVLDPVWVWSCCSSAFPQDLLQVSKKTVFPDNSETPYERLSPNLGDFLCHLSIQLAQSSLVLGKPRIL